MNKIPLAMAIEQIRALVKYHHSDKQVYWDIIFASFNECRKTVRAKRPAQQRKGKIFCIVKNCREEAIHCFCDRHMDEVRELWQNTSPVA